MVLSSIYPLMQRQALAALLVAAYAALCAGIWLRERRHLRRAAAVAAALAPARDGVPAVLVGFASQTGHAEELAWETARLLHTAGEPVQVLPLGQIDAALLARTRRALFIASTYGEGDAPDNAADFADVMQQRPAAAPVLAHLQYGLLALGDRQYAQFCGFGRQLDGWLRAAGAQPWFTPVEMDGSDPAALREWQHRLGHVATLGELPAWQAGAPFAPWTLAGRRLLNPGSAGAPVFHIVLDPPAPGVAWESGDLVQVRVPADPDHPRDYSIASIAADAQVHLLVRCAQRDDGSPGLASHWLASGVAEGGTVDLRLRAHRNFRLEDNAARPLILIGNGTGLAGLRSHLRARAAAGAGPNWLVFGERNAAHDYLHQDELETWRASGMLERLDLAFSRDQPARIYVQHRLEEAADTVRAWVHERGAALYVCGSLQGMAQGVDDALQAILGQDQVGQLARSGRYRRDVY